MRFGTWNVRSMCWAGSLTAVTSKLARYKLEFVGVQGVRLDKGVTVRAGIIFFLWRGKKIISWERDFL
jgi:hypothetical protein